MLRSVGAKYKLFAAEVVAYGEVHAAFGATTGKNLAAVGSRHSFTETVLVNSLAIRGLECSFHCRYVGFDIICGIRSAKLKIFSRLSKFFYLQHAKNSTEFMPWILCGLLSLDIVFAQTLGHSGC